MVDRGHNRHGPKKGGVLPLSRGGAGSPSNNVAEVFFRSKWNLHPSSHLTTIAIGRKFRAMPHFGKGQLGSPCNTMSFGLRSTSPPSGILIYLAIWPQQIWAENWGGELGLHLAQCGLSRDLPSCQVASRSMQPSGHNRHGPKIGGSVPFWGGGAGSPSNTMSLGLRSTFLPSGILINPAVWPRQIIAKIGGSAPFGG